MVIWRTFSGSLAPALAAVPALAVVAQEPFHVTQEVVDRVLAQVVPAVEAELGSEIDVGARLATTMEVAQVLKDENAPLMTAQLGDARAGAERAGRFGLNMSGALLAKYAFGKGRILVNPENFENIALMLDRDAINSESSLRAVLVHEVVHAADDARYRFTEKLQSLRTGPEIQAYSAVFEGHAQFVARRVCAANGWAAGFDRFTETIGYLPEEMLEDMDPAQATASRIAASDFRVGYHDGEAFITAVQRAEGEAGVARAFREPPEDLPTILHPEWYLDPATCPASELSLDAALDLFRKLDGAPGWEHTRTTLLNPQIQAAVTELSDEDMDRLLACIVRARSEVQTGGGGERMIVAVVYETTSPAEAATFVELSRRISEVRDEHMKQGPAQLRESHYTDYDEGELTGFLGIKQVEYRGRTLPVSGAVLRSGKAVVELTYSNVERSPEAMVEEAGRMLAEALGKAGDWEFESFEDAAPPAGWEPAETAGRGKPASWTVAADDTAPDGAQVLRVRAANAGRTFNLFVQPAARSADVRARVRLRADSGEEDRGGGLCWRLQDADNYYVARWNPLEDNVRVYKVVGGTRHELQSADVRLDPAAWHELEAAMVGSRMTVRLDGLQVLSVEDDTFSGPGRAGLWTKADASVSFDAFAVR